MICRSGRGEEKDGDHVGTVPQGTTPEPKPTTANCPTRGPDGGGPSCATRGHGGDIPPPPAGQVVTSGLYSKKLLQCALMVYSCLCSVIQIVLGSACWVRCEHAAQGGHSNRSGWEVHNSGGRVGPSPRMSREGCNIGQTRKKFASGTWGLVWLCTVVSLFGTYGSSMHSALQVTSGSRIRDTGRYQEGGVCGSRRCAGEHAGGRRVQEAQH